ncbi:TetR/AcrR family transcriptional regulator [Kutzneria sp. 744]|uniref:TetR/AcrR family transcriptional regulator n=1 Tax=Kutzneria sp. (strain 744) TaxID=345341 RepID=UPI0003EEB822|nr:TetR family transcriptional regulator [Kutzneria sp. 744]EWM16914.1 transcriptional regulator, TetR family [Kutzneria sp. 744]
MPFDDDLILDAAVGELRDYGLRRTSVDNVARRAGLSRATVYRRFENKNMLVQAALVRESARFFGEIVAAVGPLPTAEQRLVEGFVVGLRKVRTDALLTRLLISDPEELVPYLTLRGAGVIAAASEFLVQQYREVGSSMSRDPRVLAEMLVRLAISFTLTPAGSVAVDDDTAMRDFARSYLVPLMS